MLKGAEADQADEETREQGFARFATETEAGRELTRT
jgi:hypothetical protein